MYKLIQGMIRQKPMFLEINIHCLKDYTAHSNELGTFMKHEMTVYTQG